MRASLFAMALTLTAAAPADALKFEPLIDPDRRAILLIRDCNRMKEDLDAQGDVRCPKQQEQFAGEGLYADVAKVERPYHGDAVELRRQLAGRRYQEVWLLSGGGNLAEGIAIGRILRNAGLSVRVPNAERLRLAIGPTPRGDRALSCVSACTVAFMGGLFREVDDGATYQVHSASSFNQLPPKLMAHVDGFEPTRRLTFLLEFAISDARELAADMLRLFHDALLTPVAAAADVRRQREGALAVWRGRVPDLGMSPAELARDARLEVLEGRPALQDLLMKVERRAMDAALADLQRLAPSLGTRADKAVAMLAAMYDVSIKETFVLTPETMFEMGYITRDVTVQH
jgi:hypothetical protein